MMIGCSCQLPEGRPAAPSAAQKRLSGFFSAFLITRGLVSVAMSTVFATLVSFVLEIAFQYCIFLPLDLWTKRAIRTHGSSLAERLYIWRSEAQILVVLSTLLWLWRLRVPWLLLLLTASAYCSGHSWSPGLALEAATSGVSALWFESMECIGQAIDGGLRKVFPQQWKMEQAATAVLTGTRRITISGFLAAAGFLQRIWCALVHWRRELWEVYLHHTDAISVPAEARGGSPPRLARRATFSGVVDRLEVTDRVPPER